jgi:hypothetical protein
MITAVTGCESLIELERFTGAEERKPLPNLYDIRVWAGVCYFVGVGDAAICGAGDI